MTLVELCAGSAAVSLRYLSSSARPPLAYVGGKRGYADAILRAMGLAPGGGKGADIVLVEPGPWGEAWEHWRTEAGRADTIERLRAWADADPRWLWERLRAAPVPAEVGERVATWAVLCLWKFNNFPIRPLGGAWVMEGGFDRSKAYKLEYHQELIARGSSVPMQYKSLTVADIIGALRRLPCLSRVTVLRCDAAQVPPIPGAVVYLDPPYEGTTQCYGHDLPRPAVLALAERWRAAGAHLVAVSEASPLPLPGWHHAELGGPAGFGRTWSKQRREVLTLSRPAAGQMALMDGAA